MKSPWNCRRDHPFVSLLKNKSSLFLSLEEAEEIARIHLRSKGFDWIELRDHGNRKVPLWFGPVLWYFFFGVDEGREFGVGFRDDDPHHSIHSREVIR